MLSIDELLQMPYWIIDILPKQVPKDGPGQYFPVAKYFLDKNRLTEIKQKHIKVILKLNCYKDIWLEDKTEVNPTPDRIADEMLRRYVNIRVDDSLIISEADDTHMTLFNADDELLGLIRQLAASEGLFMWKP